MKQQQKGKIINIAAPSALRGSYGVADYAAAKGGIIALTKNAANELKSHNIQVNCISPVADTRMTEELTRFRREQLGIARREREIRAARSDRAGVFVFCHQRLRLCLRAVVGSGKDVRMECWSSGVMEEWLMRDASTSQHERKYASCPFVPEPVEWTPKIWSVS